MERNVKDKMASRKELQDNTQQLFQQFLYNSTVFIS